MSGPNETLKGRWSTLFEKRLGDPTADATYDAATAVWSRRFATGTKVTFNAKSNEGTIDWA